MVWCRENFFEDFKILFNLCDFFDVMVKKLKKVFKIVNYFFLLLLNECFFGLMFEEIGKYFLEELGVWIVVICCEMDDCGF